METDTPCQNLLLDILLARVKNSLILSPYIPASVPSSAPKLSVNQTGLWRSVGVTGPGIQSSLGRK